MPTPRPPLLLLLLPLLPRRTGALCAPPPLPAHGDALQWSRLPATELCLLPFPMADGLLPGESLQIHLREAHQLGLFEVCARRHHGCVGQLLERH